MSVDVCTPTYAAALRRAAVHAVHAWSAHGTQPWRLAVHDDVLVLSADLDRWLRRSDATGRMLALSLGAAVHQARTSLTGEGIGHEVFRSAPGENLHVRLAPSTGPGASQQEAAPAEPQGRRAVSPGPIADDDAAVLRGVLNDLEVPEGIRVRLVTDEPQQRALARLARHARLVTELDPDSEAERRAWQSTWVDPGSPTDLPDISPGHVFVVLCSAEDGPADQVRCGEAAQAALSATHRARFGAGTLDDLTERPFARAAIRTQLELTDQPQLVLRVGPAGREFSVLPRRLVEVLDAPPKSASLT